MTESPLEQAMSPDIIDQSWHRLKTEHTPWSPQVTREALQSNLLHHILTLREDVLRGTYRPKPLRQFPMQKVDGKQRNIWRINSFREHY